MDDNWRTATGYICIMLCVVAWLVMLAWMVTPTEFTFKVEMDNNTREAVESVEYPIVDTGKNYVSICNILNDSTGYCGSGAVNPDVIEIYGNCEHKFVFVSGDEQ